MPDLTPGQVFAGHRIERIAGRGGMGVVYAATDLRLKRTVALKVIAPALAAEPNFQQRFERECELAASIDHPGVIPVYSAGEEDGAAYVTMRYVEGTDLAELIRSQGRLPLPVVAAIATQLGDALEAAHSSGLVHRDVKPANVLVREERGRHQVFLTDFGLTRQLASDTRLTATGAVIGTLDYMAPEQLMDSPLDARTDVYALGCVLYETLTGSVPFPTEGAPAKLYAHTNAERPSLLDVAPDLPPALDRVIRKAMARAPEDRFQSAADLGEATAGAIEAGSAGGDATSAAGLETLGAEEAEAAEPAAATEAPATGPVTGPTDRLAAGDSVTTPVPPRTPPAPPPPRAEPPAPAAPAPRRRPMPVAIALGIAAILTAAAIGYVVFGGSDERPSDDGDQARTEADTAPQGQGGGNGGGGNESGPSPQEVATIAADVPEGGAANVTAYDRGEIDRTGYDRRVTLVQNRDPGVSESEARSQALDELILNRWMRGQAAENGTEFTLEQIAAEQASPEFAPEVANLQAVGYEPGGIDLDTEARLAAESLFGEGSAQVEALTRGYDDSNADELDQLVSVWRPSTACTVELAPLSPLCANGPEP